MRQKLTVPMEQPELWLDADVTFAQVPGWCGHVTLDLRMSVIRHHERDTSPKPCIVWICGGAWLDRNRFAHLAEFVPLARSGYVIASVEYRTSNLAPFPAPLDDVKAAIRYLRANAEHFCIDPARIGVMGESAGGYLAAMAGLTGEGDAAVQAVCDWYGPSDPSAMPAPSPASPEALMLGSADPDLLRRAAPVHHVSPKAPPFLIIHGSRDSVVPFSQSERLYDALLHAGAQADLLELDGADHADLHFFQPLVMERIRAFFDRALQAGENAIY